jgi:CheY-like chemotaxis protein
MTKIILCADDSATMQKVCEITFRASDFTFVGARSADEALEKARAQKPALVLADAVMPGKTGYDLCEAIKGDPALAGVPVMLLCGKSQAFDSARGAQVGADGHFTKPWDTQMMLDKVAEVLGKAVSEPVARPAAVAASPAPSPVPAAVTPPPAAPVRPAVPSVPSVPSVPAAPPLAAKPSIPSPPPNTARSATIMGMPTIKMPGKGADQLMAEMKSQTPMAAAAFSTELGPPGAVRGATPAAPPPAAPPPAAPVAAPPAVQPAAPAGSRAPLVKAAPSRAPSTAAAAALAARLPLTAAQVAREAGLDPTAPEVIALVKLSADIVERVVWEVVPEIAESIIRENLDKLTAKART